jgi:hypothetical protein
MQQRPLPTCGAPRSRPDPARAAVSAALNVGTISACERCSGSTSSRSSRGSQQRSPSRSSAHEDLSARERPLGLLRDDLRRVARCPVVRRTTELQRRAARARRQLRVLVGVRHLGRLLGRGDGELAVRVPAVHGLHRRDRLARAEGVERVEEAGADRSRDGRAAEARKAHDGAVSALGRGRRLPDTRVRELTAARDGVHLPRDVARAIGQQLADVQRGAGRARRSDGVVGPLPARSGLLGEDPAELAVGVPGGRRDGGFHDLPPTARARRTTRPERPARSVSYGA